MNRRYDQYDPRECGRVPLLISLWHRLFQRKHVVNTGLDLRGKIDHHVRGGMPRAGATVYVFMGRMRYDRYSGRIPERLGAPRCIPWQVGHYATWCRVPCYKKGNVPLYDC